MESLRELYEKTKELTIHWILRKEDLGEYSKDEELIYILFTWKSYACIEDTVWKNIFVNIPEILKDYKKPESLVKKLSYSILHEIAHSMTQSKDEDLIHTLSFILNSGEPYRYLNLECVPEGYRQSVLKLRDIIPIIDIE